MCLMFLQNLRFYLYMSVGAESFLYGNICRFRDCGWPQPVFKLIFRLALMMHYTNLMKINKKFATVIGAMTLAATLVGCSGEPLSTREKGTLVGTGVGAAGGAVVGAAVGAPLAGAAIGGVAGGATGFAVGNHIQNEEHGD
jgi:hypothetical protein